MSDNLTNSHVLTLLEVLQDVSLASCAFEGVGLTECTAGSTASFRVRACDARGCTVASTTADVTLTVITDGQEIPGGLLLPFTDSFAVIRLQSDFSANASCTQRHVQMPCLVL